MNPIVKPISVLLKETRQSKGISIDFVYNATKIHPNVLRALEEGTSLDLSPIYVKSHIRKYAKFLGIDQKELEKYFHPISPKENKVRFEKTFKERVREKDFFPKIPQYNFLEIKPKFIFLTKNYKWVLGIFVLILLSVLFRQVRSPKKASEAKKDNTAVLQSRESGESSVLVEKKEPAVTVKSSKPRVSDALMLTILAEKDTWIQVKADGNIVFRQVLDKYASETWEAKKNFELRLTDAGSVKLELNGKILPPIGRKGQSLKRVIINKDGFKIKK